MVKRKRAVPQRAGHTDKKARRPTVQAKLGRTKPALSFYCERCDAGAIFNPRYPEAADKFMRAHMDHGTRRWEVTKA